MKNEIKTCMEDIMDVLLLQAGEETASKGLIKDASGMKPVFKQQTQIFEKNGIMESLMLQINSEGYMTHQRIEQIVFNCLNDEVKLRKQLQMARIAEMKQLLNMKRLDGQIQLLTVHNQQFESKLQDMVF